MVLFIHKTFDLMIKKKDITEENDDEGDINDEINEKIKRKYSKD